MQVSRIVRDIEEIEEARRWCSKVLRQRLWLEAFREGPGVVGAKASVTQLADGRWQVKVEI